MADVTSQLYLVSQDSSFSLRPTVSNNGCTSVATWRGGCTKLEAGTRISQYIRAAIDSNIEINRWYRTLHGTKEVLTPKGGDLSTVFDTDKVVH